MHRQRDALVCGSRRGCGGISPLFSGIRSAGITGTRDGWRILHRVNQPTGVGGQADYATVTIQLHIHLCGPVQAIMSEPEIGESLCGHNHIVRNPQFFPFVRVITDPMVLQVDVACGRIVNLYPPPIIPCGVQYAVHIG